ncbi:hypothetical protein HID58_059155 [Brassica napus]|uniref:Uncharacterized protein n=1 Tax=Brassica napus TaxID=3708 RepID=A0ABQ7ZS67_BRANA|nr:hypothetical protein HID58_059155 [Brassica napus]
MKRHIYRNIRHKRENRSETNQWRKDIVKAVGYADGGDKISVSNDDLDGKDGVKYPNVTTDCGSFRFFFGMNIVILYPNEGDIQSQAGLASVRSDTTSTFTSIAARLEKLRKEKDGVKTEKNGYNNNTREDLKSYKSSPNFHKLNSMIDRNLADTLPSMMKFTEDQIGQLLSAFWTQSTLSDILPSNIEAIAHSFSLVLLSLRLKIIGDLNEFKKTLILGILRLNKIFVIILVFRVFQESTDL